MTNLAKGIIIGVIAFVLLVVIAIGILIGAGVTGWKSAMRSGNETAALQHLKTITVVEIQYFNTHTRTFGTFDQLVQDGFDGRFAGERPLVDGYVFTLTLAPRTSSSVASYTVRADPASSATGKNHFYLDSTSNTIHVNTGQPASANDPPIVE